METQGLRKVCGGLLPRQGLGDAWENRGMGAEIPCLMSAERAYRMTVEEAEMCRRWPAAVLPRAKSLIVGLET